jgi:hypothetical protein
MGLVGCNPAADSTQLKYTYENDADFVSIPTFAVIPAQVSGVKRNQSQHSLVTHVPCHERSALTLLVQAAIGQVMAGLPGLKFNPMMLLHGEQGVTLHAPLPTSGTTHVVTYAIQTWA